MKGTWIFVFLVWTLSAQGMDTIYASAIREGVLLPPISQWAADSTIQPALPEFSTAIRRNGIRAYSWELTNTGADTCHAAIWTDNQSAELLYLSVTGNEWGDTIYSGVLIPKTARRQLITANLFTFSVPPGESVQLTLAEASRYGLTYSGNFYLSDQRTFYRAMADVSTLDQLGKGISLLFMGSALVLMLYTLMLYFQNRKDKLYLYYSTYLFFAIWYFAQKQLISGPYFILYPNHPSLQFTLNEILQILLLVFYNLFIIVILDLDKHDRKLAQLIRYSNWGFLLYALLELAYITITSDGTVRPIVYPISRLIIFSLSLYFLYRISKRRKLPLTRYVVIGSLLFMFFTILATVFSMNMHWTAIIPLYPINFMHMGVFLEAIFFSLAMGYRIRLNNRTRTRYYKAYVRQLENNQSIIDEANTLLEQQVKQRTKEKDDLMGIMVHDLRRPLANSLGLVNILDSSSQKAEPTPPQYHDMLRQQLNTSMQIIQDVMDMHRNAAQESPPVPQGVDVGKIVDQLIELYEPDSREKSITIHCTKMEPVPQVNQDEGVIRRILDNLISNAVKYCHLHERIDISIENKNGVACVKVTDGGPGIPPAEAEKLFQKFSRLSTRPTNNEASSGMGLYLTKMLCNRIGASLDAYNVTGRGACFEVTFSGLS